MFQFQGLPYAYTATHYAVYWTQLRYNQCRWSHWLWRTLQARLGELNYPAHCRAYSSNFRWILRFQYWMQARFHPNRCPDCRCIASSFYLCLHWELVNYLLYLSQMCQVAGFSFQSGNLPAKSGTLLQVVFWPNQLVSESYGILHGIWPLYLYLSS